MGYGSVKLRRITAIKRRKRSRTVVSFSIAIILILLPTVLLYNDISSEYKGIEIDGSFDDWKGVKYYTDRTDSPNPNIDIIEYGITSDSLETSFYLKVNGIILQGTPPQDGTRLGADTVHIFIDTDNNIDTGYSVEGLGADAMVQVKGVENQVKSTNSYMFDDTRSQDDWNGWEYWFAGSAGINENELETQIPVLNDELETEPNVCFQITDSSYNEDISDHVISEDKCVLEIREYNMVDELLEIGSRNNEFLRIELKAHGADVVLDAVSLLRHGTATDSDTDEISLYKDEDENGFLSIDDKVIASETRGFMDEIVNLNLYEPLHINKDETVNFFVYVGISPAAQPYHSIGLSLFDAKISGGIVSRSVLSESHTKAYIGSVPDHVIIDGAFADWNNFDKIKDPYSDSSKPSTNLLEYSVTSDTENVFLYLKVAGNIMEGTRAPVLSTFYSQETVEVIDSDNDRVPDGTDPNPFDARDSDGDGFSDDYETVVTKTDIFNIDTDSDGWVDSYDIAPLNPEIPRTMQDQPTTQMQVGKDTAYIFIDADRNPASGYRVSSGSAIMGADFMIELSGKYGYFFKKDLLQYSGDGNDWKWDQLGTVHTGKDSSRLELEFNSNSIGLDAQQGADFFIWISEWTDEVMDYSEDIVTYLPDDGSVQPAPSRLPQTRANNPYSSQTFHPISASDDDAGSPDPTVLDELAPGDAQYEPCGKDTVYAWIECGFAPANIPTGSVINNMTFYMGYYCDSDWDITAEHSGVIWSTTSGGAEHDIANYTVSTSDTDEVYLLTSDLPSAGELNSEIFIRVSGYDISQPAEDDLFLDYLYFTINYTIPQIVINEVMFNPPGDDNNSEWVELYNPGGTAVDLTGWSLTDNDGNVFNLSGAGSIAPGAYLVCHLAQSGTNSSTDIYGSMNGTIAKQPGPAEGNDTAIWGIPSAQKYNYGTTENLQIQGGTSTPKKILVGLDIQSIPSNAVINNASYQIYKHAGGGGTATISLHKLNHTWNEGTGDSNQNSGILNGVTWLERWYGNNANDGNEPWDESDPDWAALGGDYDPAVVDTATVGNNDLWLNFNITDLMQKWVNNSEPNCGFVLTSDLDATKELYSSDNSKDILLRPKYYIEYTVNTVLEDADELALLDGTGAVVDYVAWGADPGGDDDIAGGQGQWTDGEFIDTSEFSEGESLGRDRYSTDTDTTSDWENSTTSKADPYGTNSTIATPGICNIPELDDIRFLFVTFLVASMIIVLIRRNKHRSRGN